MRSRSVCAHVFPRKQTVTPRRGIRRPLRRDLGPAAPRGSAAPALRGSRTRGRATAFTENQNDFSLHRGRGIHQRVTAPCPKWWRAAPAHSFLLGAGRDRPQGVAAAFASFAGVAQGQRSRRALERVARREGLSRSPNDIDSRARLVLAESARSGGRQRCANAFEGNR